VEWTAGRRHGRVDEVDVLVDEWMTIDEAASYLKVSRRTLYRWMDNGEVPYFELAAGVVARRIRREDLEDLLVEAE